MAKLIDNNNDDATAPETPYEGQARGVSGRGTSLSWWGLAVAGLFATGIALFVFTRGPGTDPAPNGGANQSGAVSQPAPSQNSP